LLENPLRVRTFSLNSLVGDLLTGVPPALSLQALDKLKLSPLIKGLNNAPILVEHSIIR